MAALLALLLATLAPGPLARATPVDADSRAHLTLWSAYDARHGGYRLMARRAGWTFPVPVAEAPAPFDADAGTDARGAPAIVFVRRGDVHAVGLGPGDRERAIPLASVPGVEDTRPSLAHGLVVWARETGAGDPPVLLATALDGGRVARPLDPRLIGGRRGAVRSLESDGRRVALAFATPGAPGAGVADLRLADLRAGTVRTLARTGVGEGGQTYRGLSLDAGTLYAYKQCDGDPAGCDDGSAGVLRLRPGARRLQRVVAGDRPLAGFAVANGRMTRVQCGAVRCTLRTAPAP